VAPDVLEAACNIFRFPSRIGAAFPHSSGNGLNIQLEALPLGEGRLWAAPFKPQAALF